MRNEAKKAVFEVTKALTGGKRAQEMSRSEFYQLPRRKWDEEIHCNSLILLPMRQQYENTQYRCMDFVAVDGKDMPLCRVSGCSDVLHIGGIAGGILKRGGRRIGSWALDCLDASGLYRLFAHDMKDGEYMVVGLALSSLEVWIAENEQART